MPTTQICAVCAGAVVLSVCAMKNRPRGRFERRLASLLEFGARRRRSRTSSVAAQPTLQLKRPRKRRRVKPEPVSVLSPLLTAVLS